MAAKQSERIKLWGIVQGVGFRPYVAKTANLLDMKGEVLNTGGLVEIILTDTEERINRFIERLLSCKPEPAEIVHIKREVIEYRNFETFTIIKSDDGDDDAAMIPADLAICPNCLEELYNKKNPRYHHPFISCMVCGPRYTIMDRIPYDRENTSMADFPMCDFCSNEYTDLHDRRYHAQTISCHECGPHLLWKSRDERLCESSDEEILDYAADTLKNEGVIAFKSVGGYNLVADPFSSNAVKKLRDIKNRESKPFAVMFRSLEQIKEFCHVNELEAKLLESSARPIILLEHKEFDDYNKFNEFKKSRFIGAFLPSFAAQYLLLDRISPLIFTSANISDMPMIKDEREISRLIKSDSASLIDGILYNERRILVRADDSVVRIIDGQPQMIRRSKGYAPVPLYIEFSKTQAEAAPSEPKRFPGIYAAGGQLKNSFALTKGNFLYMSQFFGDMDTVENQQVYTDSFDRMKKLFRTEPAAVACDLHPLYFTSTFAEHYAKKHGLPLIHVQHHHAHAASVIAENNLTGKVIGISFDGTGYGTDGCIWGGEIFICDEANAERIAHLKYVNMIGGDSSVKDAVRSALSYIYSYDTPYYSYSLNASEDASETLNDHRCPSCTQSSQCRIIQVDISDIIEYGKERILSLPKSVLAAKALEKGINTVKSSSMGRLFDAVSALLNIKDYNDYEGQCAIMLEDSAAFAQKCPGLSKKCDMALSFHNRIIDMTICECIAARKKYHTNQVALSGGTFQNKILMEGILEKLRSNGFKPYYNVSVSPNDGGIALGQAYVAGNFIRKNYDSHINQRA